MRDDTRSRREDQIEAAAYALLAERGYAGTSMLNIAKRAKASNETLYRWYGDKRGLYLALIAKNAEAATQVLQAAEAKDMAPQDALAKLGPVLLCLLTGDKAVALNQAAAADATGELGQALAQAGRDTVAPMIGKVFENLRADGVLSFKDTGDAVDLYLSLLVGDLQIRRVIGVLPGLSEDQVSARAAAATAQLALLLGSKR